MIRHNFFQGAFALAMLLGVSEAKDAFVIGAESNGLSSQYGWKTDYEAARHAARELDKPLMVVLRCVP